MDMQLISLIFITVVLSAVNCWCPEGWNNCGGQQCMKLIYVTPRVRSWEHALEACRLIDGDLYSPRETIQKQWFYREVARRTSIQGWWVGFNKRDQPQWKFSDNTPENSLGGPNWQSGFPTGDANKKCAAIFAKPEIGFRNLDCSTQLAYACVRRKNKPIRCAYLWREWSNYCLRAYSRTAANWQNAENTCVNGGGNLVFINSDPDQRAIADWATGYRKDFWIGLRSDNAGVFRWSNGNSLTTLAWQPNQPVYMTPKSRTCVYNAKDTAWNQAWATKDCNDGSLSWICRKPQGECAPGWRIFQSSCYEYHVNYKLSWMDAKSFCESRGAYLLTIRNTEENKFIEGRLKELNDAGIDILWLGASDIILNGEFRWVTGEKVSDGYKAWARTPSGRPGKTSCATIITAQATNRWGVTTNCLQQHGFICKVATGTEVTPLSTVPASYVCPAGWSLHQGECYRQIDEESDWLTARSKCRQNQPQADLATIMNSHEENFIIGLNFNTETWIGLNKRPPAYKWSWLDNTDSIMDYLNWDEGYPSSTRPDQCAVIINMNGKKGKWRTLVCNQRRAALCKTNGIYFSPPSVTPRLPTSGWTVKCGPGWEDDITTPYCYQFNRQFTNWQSARQACQNNGGDIVSITSAHEQRYIAAKIKSFTGIRMWIGMNDLGRPNRWKWTTTDPVAYFNWESGAPRRGNNIGDCGVILMSTSKWNNAQCSNQYGYICKKRGIVPTTTSKPTTTAVVPPGFHRGCPGGWRGYQGYCYQVVPRRSTSYQDAKAACRRLGSDLVSIHSQDEQNFVQSYTKEIITPPVGAGMVAIGLSEIRAKGIYEWSDGTKVDYTNWDPYEPNNYPLSSEDCVNMYIGSGGWNDMRCESHGYFRGYVCKQTMKILPGTVTSSPTNCPAGWEYSYGNWCYKFGKDAYSWDRANQTCVTSGGQLADIQGRFEQAYVSAILAVERSPHWIGLTNRGQSDRSYKWTSGSPVRYTNWYRDFTGNEENQCVSMTTTQPVGLWQPMDCDSAHQYICKRLKTGYTPTPPNTQPPVPCTVGWQGFGNFCYRTWNPSNTTQRLNWMQALDFCRRMGADLVSIHDANENAFVAQNSPNWSVLSPEFWIGLNHRDPEKGEHWTDDSAVNYLNWKPDQPQRYEQQFNCVHLDMRNPKWKYSNCNVPKNWICKAQRGTTIRPEPTIIPPDKSASCGTDTDWWHHNGYCYYISKSANNENRKDWHEARSFCMSRGADLVSIHTNAEHLMLIELLGKYSYDQTGSGKVWIGLSELQRMGQYRWSDGSPTDMLRWAPGEPNDYRHGQRCVDMYPWDGFWNDDNCNDKRGFICKKLNGTYIPRTATPSQVVPGYCPKGFFEIGNKCLGAFNVESGPKVNWSTAVQECRKKGGIRPDLASINSHQENAIVTAQLRPKFGFGLWIGFHHDRVEQNTWKWVDNSRVVYTNWNQGEPNNPTIEKCTDIISYNQGARQGLWNNVPCSEQRGYVCQTFKDINNQVRTSPVLPPNGQPCKQNYQPYLEGCYKVVKTEVTWQEARDACQREVADLVSIHRDVENAAVYAFSGLYNQKSTWIGLNNLQSQGQYKWTDGWLLDYSNWGRNEPIDGPGRGCVSMNKLGYWNNTECNNRLQYVCKTTTVKPKTPPPTSEPGACPSTQWVPHGRYCYQFESERKPWPLAEFQCVQMGAHLASVVDMAENQFVQGQLQANEKVTKNAWIGMLKRGTTSGWYWSDNGPTGFTNWDQDEPNNDNEDEECVEMLPQNGKWNDNNCAAKRPFVCKTLKSFFTTTQPVLPGQSTTTRGGSGTPQNPSKRPTMPTNQPTAGPGTNMPRISNTGLSSGGKVGVAFAVLVLILGAALCGILYFRRKGLPHLPMSSLTNPLYQSTRLKKPSADPDSSSA